MKRRPKRRPDGRWQRRRCGKLFISSISQADADRKAEEYARDIKNGLARVSAGLTVAQFSADWIKNNYIGVSDVWYDRVSSIVDRFNSDYGNVLIKDIRPEDIKRHYSNYYGNMSKSTISKVSTILKKMFEAAVENGYCRYNPAKSVSAKPHAGHEGSHRAITDTERKIIEEIATDHEYYPIAMIMLHAGLRPGEAFALQIDRDVDFDKKTITVREFVHFSGKNIHISDAGKTKKAKRVVPLSEKLERVLRGKKEELLSQKWMNRNIGINTKCMLKKH